MGDAQQQLPLFLRVFLCRLKLRSHRRLGTTLRGVTLAALAAQHEDLAPSLALTRVSIFLQNATK